MKIPLVLLAVLLASCTTDPVTGKKKFLNRTGGEWGAIGIGFGQKAAPLLKSEYDAAGQTATK
jgi:hypothetical protein